MTEQELSLEDQTQDLENEIPEASEVVEEAADDGRQWYIVQCFSAQEYKVKDRIEKLVEEKSYQNRLFRVLVPEEETIEIKNNKRVEKTTKIYPGYVFIQMIYDNDIYYDIRSILGVSGFVGTRNYPTPVTEDEMLKILRKVGDKTRKIDVDFEEGEVIKVVAGPFRGYSGPISEINAEKGSLKALISIFGRETPVQLDFDQVEKSVE
ncbi:transcription termination/antitermination factor NusG [bacterium]|nr:transcription termination/antitermination factor NusG [bacterium]